MDIIDKLTKDERRASKLLSKQEVRFFVDAYYTIQNNRIRSAHQKRSLSESGEPNELLSWLEKQDRRVENQIKIILANFTLNHPQGEWPLSITGIGPIITAGLIAHIDIHKAPTVGHIWRYAGLDPTSEWKKGQKRPWNAALKTLCAFKIGESFVKQKNRETDYYGKVYAKRKEFEIERNDLEYNKELAASILSKGRYSTTTPTWACLIEGKLSPAHLHARARRYAVKLFLSHLHEVWYKLEFKKDPPLPYPIVYLPGHVHKVDPPNHPQSQTMSEPSL